MEFTALFWLIAFVIFLIVEAATLGLASIYFAIGALVALLIAAISNDIIWLQVVSFLVVSSVTLYFTRPLAQKYVNSKRQPTNADRMLDMVSIVTEDIDNIKGKGAVSVGGKIWTARSLTGEFITKGTKVRATSIEGVKLIVAPIVSDDAKSDIHETTTLGE